MVDIAIVGTGVAGLSAAATARARNKSVLLFGDAEIGGKLLTAHEIKNFLGFFGKTPGQIKSELRAQMDALGISVTERKITGVYPMGDHFSLLSGQEQFDAKKVIVATGVSFGKQLPGEAEFLGRGVSYCATCDGMLHRGKRVAVISYSAREAAEAEFLSEICTEVLYFPMHREEVPESLSKRENVRILSANGFSISGKMKADALKFVEGGAEKSEATSCVFILRENIPPAQLVAGIEMDGNHIKVDRQMRTSVPGLFAAGDITGTPYQYAKSAGEGNVAALSACAG